MLKASKRRVAAASAPMLMVKVTADPLGFEMCTCLMIAFRVDGAVYLVAAAFETCAGPAILVATRGIHRPPIGDLLGLFEPVPQARDGVRPDAGHLPREPGQDEVAHHLAHLH